MRDEVWFKHDARSRLDPKMAFFFKLHGVAGYGIFWSLIETLHYQNDHEIDLNMELAGIADQLKMEEADLQQVVDRLVQCGLFERQGNTVFQPKLKRDQAKRSEAQALEKEEMRELGRRGGLASAAKRRNAVSLMESITSNQSATDRSSDRSSDAQANPTLERRERVDKIYKDPSDPLEGAPPTNQPVAQQKTKNFAPGITLTEQGFKSLQSEFGDASFRYYVPICSDWLKSNGKRKSDAAAFMRNWIRKELAERKGFYYPKREQFKPHTAATTAEKNLEYIRNRYGEDYANQVLAGDVGSQKKSIIEPDDRGDLVPSITDPK